MALLKRSFCLFLWCLVMGAEHLHGQGVVKRIPVGEGWANNSVNAVVFRKNSVVTWRDTQFVAYYDSDQYVILAKRKQGTENWTLKKTSYKGNAADAHNSISIMVDGEGFLHLAWDHHNTPLRYCRGLAPGSLILSEPLKMTRTDEERVTYPEFYRLKNGDLLFLYRHGESGKGNLVVSYYQTKKKLWTRLHQNLIDGEGIRNAYWQADVDKSGTIHLSWVWRESADVSSNHDLCYARSRDRGETWENSGGEKYRLPITASTAEYACRIPENSELINQTSMTADESGNPYIATYWRDRDSDIPQYRIVYKVNSSWKTFTATFRTTPFSLSGTGTKKIPISRPQIVVQKNWNKISAIMIFRDIERNSVVSSMVVDDLLKEKWRLHDLIHSSVESWEPSFDTEYWKQKHELHLFLQKVQQADSEGKGSAASEPVYILEWKPGRTSR